MKLRLLHLFGCGLVASLPFLFAEATKKPMSTNIDKGTLDDEEAWSNSPQQLSPLHPLGHNKEITNNSINFVDDKGEKVEHLHLDVGVENRKMKDSYESDPCNFILTVCNLLSLLAPKHAIATTVTKPKQVDVNEPHDAKHSQMLAVRDIIAGKRYGDMKSFIQ